MVSVRSSSCLPRSSRTQLQNMTHNLQLPAWTAVEMKPCSHSQASCLAQADFLDEPGSSQQDHREPAAANMLQGQTVDQMECAECIICWEAAANITVKSKGILAMLRAG